jgi:hypothetical protein
MSIPGAFRGKGFGEARLRSGTGRAAAAPGMLHGQELFPLWIACEVSCRIRVREIIDPVRRDKLFRRRGIPGDSFCGKWLAAADFTPRLFFNSRLWFPRLCQ